MQALEDLFQKRQKLNIEAVKVLLPPEVGAPLPRPTVRTLLCLHGLLLPYALFC